VTFIYQECKTHLPANPEEKVINKEKESRSQPIRTIARWVGSLLKHGGDEEVASALASGTPHHELASPGSFD
jgi:hypothetical protein